MVIPNFNRGHVLGEAVASALGQDGPQVEILVCDDGSSDDSEAVVASFGDSRVRWLPGHPTGGPASPRNRGIAAATGAWVAFLDSDDRWRQGKLEAQLEAVERASAVACTTNAYRFRPASHEPDGLLHASLPERITLAEQLRANLMITSAVLVSTSVVRKVGGFPEAAARSIFEDYALWLRIAASGPVCALDQPWVDYLDDADNSLRGEMALELRCTANALKDFHRWRRVAQPGRRTTVGEWWTMGRQLVSLVSVRSVAARAVGPGRGQ